MKGLNFYPMDPVSILEFLHPIKVACDIISIQGAAIWLLPYFMKMLAAAVLTARLSLKSKSSHHSYKEVLTTYCQVVNHLLETYPRDDIIAEMDSRVARYIRPSNISPLQFANERWPRKLWCLQVSD